MSTRVSCALAVVCLSVAAAARPVEPGRFDGRSWWAHVKALADDRLQGRETGSPGLREAESYVVEQLRKAGLEPAGDNGGFYQEVELESRQRDPSPWREHLVVRGRGRDRALPVGA